MVRHSLRIKIVELLVDAWVRKVMTDSGNSSKVPSVGINKALGCSRFIRLFGFNETWSS